MMLSSRLLFILSGHPRTRLPSLFHRIERLSKSLTTSYCTKIDDRSEKLNQENQDQLREDKIFTIPNGLCVMRILAAPLLAFTISSQRHLESLIIFTFAGLTDLADGYIARNFKGQRSTLGSLLDPLADKILVSTLFISLTVAGQLPVALAAIVIARDLILILAGLLLRLKSLPSPRSLSAFFDPRLKTMEVFPSLLSKFNTAFQLLLIGLTLGAPLLNLENHIFMDYLQYLVSGTTIASGINYALRNPYRLINGAKKSNKSS